MARAQDCPFEPHEAVADTLDPRGYYPLEVGNVWETHHYDELFFLRLWREEVVRDTIVAGETFYRLAATQYSPPGVSDWGDPDFQEGDSLRVGHTISAWVTVRDSGMVGLTVEDNLLSFVFTKIDHPLNAPFRSCHEYSGLEWVVLSGEEYSMGRPSGVPPLNYHDTVKCFSSLFAGACFGYGIGPVYADYEINVMLPVSYARVGDREYGESLFDRYVVVSGRPTETATRTPVTLRNAPNPFASSTSLHFSIPTVGRVTINVVDVLGRSIAEPVSDTPYAPGEYSVEWHAYGLAPGLYFGSILLENGTAAMTTMVLVH